MEQTPIAALKASGKLNRGRDALGPWDAAERRPALRMARGHFPWHSRQPIDAQGNVPISSGAMRK